MKKDLLFVGIIERASIGKTIADQPWKPIIFDLPPYEVVKPSSSYMFTLGSAHASLATTAYGFKYTSGIDVFRHDFNGSPSEPLVNIDHYIAGAVDSKNFAVFRTPPQPYHWLKPSDEILTYVPPLWRQTLMSMLKNPRDKT